MALTSMGGGFRKGEEVVFFLDVLPNDPPPLAELEGFLLRGGGSGRLAFLGRLS